MRNSGRKVLCGYIGCLKNSNNLNNFRIGPFGVFVYFCDDHYEEFCNFLQVIKAKNVSWNTDLK
jgi:hypothetical protein